jgi:ribonuclease HI
MRAYVDGSFSNGRCGWGVVICDGPYSCTNAIFEDKGVLEDDHGHRQIGGELKAAMVALWWAIQNDVHEIEIVYDYVGIQRWVTGEWHANKPMTKMYQRWMRNKIEEFSILVYWRHVRGHTGDPGNERADQLAKEATCLGT